MSKKRAKIKLSELRRIASFQATKAEAAAFFGIGRKTFNKLLEDKRARKAWEGGRETGKLSLRRRQFSLSGTNAQMAIHLGKHWLGQNEVVNHELTGKDGGPIQTMDLTKLNAKERQKLRDILTRANQPE